MTKIAGITALTDVKSLLETLDAEVSIVTDIKAVGLDGSNKERIVLQLDQENIDYFLHADDSFHKVAISILVITYQGYDRFNTLTSSVFDTLKSNARFSINNNNYSDMIVKGFTDLSKQYKGSWYGIFDVQLRRVNP